MGNLRAGDNLFVVPLMNMRLGKLGARDYRPLNKRRAGIHRNFVGGAGIDHDGVLKEVCRCIPFGSVQYNIKGEPGEGVKSHMHIGNVTHTKLRGIHAEHIR